MKLKIGTWVRHNTFQKHVGYIDKIDTMNGNEYYCVEFTFPVKKRMCCLEEEVKECDTSLVDEDKKALENLFTDLSLLTKDKEWFKELCESYEK